MINPKDINKGGHLIHMLSDDLFNGSNTKQVFSAKTGKWLGTITKGQELNFEEHAEEETPKEIEKPNPSQLLLF